MNHAWLAIKHLLWKLDYETRTRPTNGARPR